MLDIHFIREHSSLIKENLKKRFQEKKVPLVDELLGKEKQWRELKGDVDSLRKERNNLTEKINTTKKNGGDISALVKKAKELPEKIKQLDEELDALRKRIDQIHLELPNILDSKVPIGKDSSENKVIRTWGKPTKFKFEIKNHAELLESLGCANFESGIQNAGRGFNYLLKEGALLDLALQRYGIDFLLKKKFTPVIPPMLLNFETMLGAANGLGDFETTMYKIENEDLYLLGTAEHTLVALNKNKLLKKEDFPIKMFASTPCFRKEIGGHGIDMKWLFRMHQFNKVEQVVLTIPENSAKMHEEMQKITESFFQSLKIPYRVLEICSGDLGNKFARQWDIEAWFPRQQEYREVTSAGNCKEFQSVALNIRYMDGDKKVYPHILNNTMIATSRAMVAILENYQQKDGSVKIPTVLQKYCGFKKIERRK